MGCGCCSKGLLGFGGWFVSSISFVLELDVKSILYVNGKSGGGRVEVEWGKVPHLNGIK